MGLAGIILISNAKSISIWQSKQRTWKPSVASPGSAWSWPQSGQRYDVSMTRRYERRVPTGWHSAASPR